MHWYSLKFLFSIFKVNAIMKSTQSKSFSCVKSLIKRSFNVSLWRYLFCYIWTISINCSTMFVAIVDFEKIWQISLVFLQTHFFSIVARCKEAGKKRESIYFSGWDSEQFVTRRMMIRSNLMAKFTGIIYLSKMVWN